MVKVLWHAMVEMTEWMYLPPWIMPTRIKREMIIIPALWMNTIIQLIRLMVHRLH